MRRILCLTVLFVFALGSAGCSLVSIPAEVRTAAELNQKASAQAVKDWEKSVEDVVEIVRHLLKKELAEVQGRTLAKMAKIATPENFIELQKRYEDLMAQKTAEIDAEMNKLRDKLLLNAGNARMAALLAQRMVDYLRAQNNSKITPQRAANFAEEILKIYQNIKNN